MTVGATGLPDFEPGTVWLVGAGPGDPGLLTRLAVHALANADAVVYDALISDAILDFAGPQATRTYAGKRGGKPWPKQPAITERIIALARQGNRVLRLKGGDPFVFGRGGEEALALTRAEIAFRIVPGVTAGIGGHGYAGIPATHRDCNSAVLFLTGHDATGETPQAIDWEAAARIPVIVMYMALKHLEDIATRLIAAVRAGDEPVALVENATLPNQRVVTTTLASAAADAAAHNVSPPAIVTVGPVVDLRSVLQGVMLEQRPTADFGAVSQRRVGT